MGSLKICFAEQTRYFLHLEISKCISYYLECCLAQNQSHFYPPCPTWSDIISKFGKNSPNELKCDNGLFPTEFLEFFFQNHSTLKALISLMDLKHHLLVHLYLLFLP